MICFTWEMNPNIHIGIPLFWLSPCIYIVGIENMYFRSFIEIIVGVLLKDGILLTMEKLLRENNKYFMKNKQWVYLVLLANVTKKSMEKLNDL